MSSTIRLKDNTVKRLYEFGAFQRSYDFVMNNLLDACEVLRSAMVGGESLRDVAMRLVREEKVKQRQRVPVPASPV